MAWAAASSGISIFLPPLPTNLEEKAAWEPSTRWRASTLQYSVGTKARISFSRSTISRTATDWTRPAERPLRTLRQRKGLSL